MKQLMRFISSIKMKGGNNLGKEDKLESYSVSACAAVRIFFRECMF